MPNISQSKGNKKMKFGQLIEYNKNNIFLQKLCSKRGNETSSIPHFVFLKSLRLGLVNFWKIMKNWKIGSLYSKFNADYESTNIFLYESIFQIFSILLHLLFFTHLAFSKKKKKKRKECILLNFKESPAAVTRYRHIGKGYSKSDALLNTTLY